MPEKPPEPPGLWLWFVVVVVVVVPASSAKLRSWEFQLGPGTSVGSLTEEEEGEEDRVPFLSPFMLLLWGLWHLLAPSAPDLDDQQAHQLGGLPHGQRRSAPKRSTAGGGEGVTGGWEAGWEYLLLGPLCGHEEENFRRISSWVSLALSRPHLQRRSPRLHFEQLVTPDALQDSRGRFSSTSLGACARGR